MVCTCMCRSVVDENEERTEQVFVHQGRRRGGAQRVEGGRGGRRGKLQVSVHFSIATHIKTKSEPKNTARVPNKTNTESNLPWLSSPSTSYAP